jgi:hypothetical protein
MFYRQGITFITQTLASDKIGPKIQSKSSQTAPTMGLTSTTTKYIFSTRLPIPQQLALQS